MHSPEKPASKSGLSLLEFLLILGILVLSVATIAPSVIKAKESIAVERSARALASCSDAVKRIIAEQLVATNQTPITLKMVEASLKKAGSTPPIWPPEADLSSFSADASNDLSIVVMLQSGQRTVTLDDISSPQ